MNRKIPCQHCGQPKDWLSVYGCRACSPRHRRKSSRRLADELGVPVDRIRKYGGAAHLNTLDSAARNLILGIRRVA